MKILFLYGNVSGSTLLPLNIPILSAIAKENGCEVDLFDTTWYSPEQLGMYDFEKKKEELLMVKPFERSTKWKKTDVCQDFQNKVNDYKPDLICVTFVEDTINLELKLLKNLDKSYNVLAGGVGATFNYEKILTSGLVNWLCRGEGEICLKEVIDCFKENRIQDIDRLNNIVIALKMGSVENNRIREIENVAFRINKLNKPIDINSLPCPDFDIFGKDRIVRIMNGKEYVMIHYELDRGCPYSCTYCCASSIKETYLVQNHKNYYRQKNNKKIIEDLILLKEKYNPNYIDFSSETFFARSYNNLKEFFKLYKEYINIPFWCQSRPETLTKQKVKLLKESGCSDFQIGIEHGNEKFRKKWLKRTGSNEQILKACWLLEEYEIPYTVNCIIGFPDETRSDIYDTIALCRKIKPKNYNCYLMNPYKGTWLYDYCIENDLLEIDSESRQILEGKDIKYKYLTKKQLLGIQRVFSMYCKFDSDWGNHIYDAETDDDKFKELREKYIKEYYE